MYWGGEGRGGEGRGRGGEGRGRGGEGDTCEALCGTHLAGGGYLLCKGEDLPLVHTTKLGINTKVVLIKGLWGRGGERREGRGDEGQH